MLHHRLLPSALTRLAHLRFRVLMRKSDELHGLNLLRLLAEYHNIYFLFYLKLSLYLFCLLFNLV